MRELPRMSALIKVLPRILQTYCCILPDTNTAPLKLMVSVWMKAGGVDLVPRTPVCAVHNVDSERCTYCWNAAHWHSRILMEIVHWQ
ncbi:hypothetical protein ANANG_G00118980 [Anguilla anguilla]|uniref:Uncharacterized protein n=1 Tax=Anguilla anguilla TaxID=7936 RepID=A0A9D3MEX3_ANGAN|nr:hypothetical protein ANANG_G00118980 [Anguilla anguilla]